MPALALALLAVLGSAALVIDRLSLDTAHTELRTAAEAAALAAARELANDDRLRSDYQPAALQRKARFAAARIAAENVIAGESLSLKTDAEDDVRFGCLRLDPATGEMIFDKVDETGEPTSVAVHARRTADRDAAVALPFRTLYAPTDADVVAVAEASLDFHVVGLRPVDNLPIPTLPLAILARANASDETPHKHAPRTRETKAKSESPSKPQPVPNWARDIEQRRGADRFGYDTESGQVTNTGDGIPEITLRTAAHSHSPRTNAFVVGLTGGLTQDDLRRQIREGWSVTDLESAGGELLFDRGCLSMAGLRGVESNLLAESLRAVLGQARVVLLYDRVDGSPRATVAELNVVGLVAGRVMSVREISDCECEIVYQPAVMATRSAVVADQPTKSTDGQTNKYIANLRLTN